MIMMARRERKENEMSRGYGSLRLWATVLVVGVGGVIFVGIGVIFAMIESPTFLQAMAFLLIGAPLAVLFASWPIALGQGLRALADVAEYVRDQQGFPAQRLSEGEHAPRA
jgi:cation transport ATPase